MAIEIHYKGKLKSEAEYIKLINTVRFHAGQYGWSTEDYAHPDETLIRTSTDDKGRFKISEYHGPVKGIITYPTYYESLMFKFDGHLCCQWSCKTQSASSDTHICVIELFDMILPRFECLDLQDDSGYWDHRDAKRLEQALYTDAATPDIEKGLNKNGQEPPEDVSV